jgi:CubicO group peptidase (beta-lactamase class C family)
LPGRLPSGVLRIAIGGQPVIEHRAGPAGSTDGEPCTPRTRFQIASVSKQFTAAAVLPAGWRRRMMFTAYAAAGQGPGTWGSDDAYGYGWYLHGLASTTLRYHSGHNSGFNSFSAWVPENEASLVILSNDDSTDPQAIAQELVRSGLWPAR